MLPLRKDVGAPVKEKYYIWYLGILKIHFSHSQLLQFINITIKISSVTHVRKSIT
jgi:hypothetical protein